MSSKYLFILPIFFDFLKGIFSLKYSSCLKLSTHKKSFLVLLGKYLYNAIITGQILVNFVDNWIFILTFSCFLEIFFFKHCYFMITYQFIQNFSTNHKTTRAEEVLCWCIRKVLVSILFSTLILLYFFNMVLFDSKTA